MARDLVPSARALAAARAAAAPRRLVADIPCAVRNAGASGVTIPYNVGLDIGAADFGIMVWLRGIRRPGVNSDVCVRLGGAGPTGFYILVPAADNRLRLVLFDAAGNFDSVYSTAGQIPWGNWFLLAANRSTVPAQIGLSINAQAFSTAASTPRDTTRNASMTIGRSTAGEFWTQDTGEFLLRKGSAFSQSEIDDYYYNERRPAGLTSAWLATEGAGVQVADSIGGFNGTLNVASWTTETRCKLRGLA